MDYPREKYWQALDILVGASPLQERLTYAGEVLLRLMDGDISDAELAKRHAAVMKTLTAKPFSDDRKTLPRDLSDEEATNLSREILSIYIGLRGGI